MSETAINPDTLLVLGLIGLAVVLTVVAVDSVLSRPRRSEEGEQLPTLRQEIKARLQKHLDWHYAGRKRHRYHSHHRDGTAKTH